jgi:5'-3' exonuclease
LVTDDSKPYKRKILCPDYKGNRKHDDSVFFERYLESMKYVDDFIKKLHLPMMKLEGYESDDLMAFAIQQCNQSFDEFVLGTNDSDIYALLNEKSPRIIIDRGKRGVYTSKEFFNDYSGISLDDWIKVGSLAGTHNAVPQAVPRCGIPTAIKIIKDQTKWDNAYSKYKDQIEMNVRLIKLPFDNEIDKNLLQFTRCEFKVNNVLSFLENTYGIQATMSMELALQKLSDYVNVMS